MGKGRAECSAPPGGSHSSAKIKNQSINQSIIPRACVVFNEIPGGREVFTGEIATHARKCHLNVFQREISPIESETKTCLIVKEQNRETLKHFTRFFNRVLQSQGSWEFIQADDGVTWLHWTEREVTTQVIRNNTPPPPC